MADVIPLKLVAVGGGQGELREFAAGDALQLQGALNLAGIVAVASAGTVDIGAEESNTLSVSGTTTITSLGSAGAGVYRWLVFEGVLTLTHNATSLILPGGANITTAAGDAGLFFSLGGGNWRCLHYPSAGGGGGGFVYDRSNIVGTVSQESGTPTGAVMEGGSNSNGTYLRLADGTQYCAKTHIIKDSGDSTTGNKSSTWTFPAEFVSGPSLVGIVNTSAPSQRYGLSALTTTSTTGSVYYYEAAGTAGVVYGRLFAIGRWY